MKTVVTGFVLVLGAVIQAVIPSWPFLGQAKLPVMLGLVIYYGLTTPRRTSLKIAVVAGLLYDSLSLIPLGFSVALFMLLALLLCTLQGRVFVRQSMTYVLLGAAANTGMTLLLFGMLVMAGQLEASTQLLLMKLLGAAVLGSVVIPVVVKLVMTLEDVLGLGFAEEGVW